MFFTLKFNSPTNIFGESVIEKKLEYAGKKYGLHMEIFVGVPNPDTRYNMYFDQISNGIKLLVYNRTLVPTSTDAIDLKEILNY
jgi:hypothetical protein